MAMPATVQTPKATLDDLYRESGKAELIGGRIVRFMPTGQKPSRVTGRIFRALDDYSQQTGRGEAHGDGVGYAIEGLSSGRESFSPDASFYDGPPPANPMRFIEGPPKLAVEVRSENDYGPAAEESMAEKRADYFAAGTLVVWDVDPIREQVHVYRHFDPERPTTFGRGETADAEPALPGWRVAVTPLFT